VWAFDLFKSDAQDLRGLDLGLAFRADEVQAYEDRFEVDLPAGWHKAKRPDGTLSLLVVTTVRGNSLFQNGGNVVITTLGASASEAG